MPGCCTTIDEHFSADKAAALEADLNAKGLPAETELLAHALRNADITNLTVLDIGAGIGALAEQLLHAGARSAVLVDISRAYLDTARRRLERSFDGRVRFEHGDITERAPRLDAADVVTLDKVICCYPAMQTLVDQSTNKARRYYAASYPRDRWLVHLAIGFENLLRRLRRNPFRAYVHDVAQIEERIRANGFEMKSIAQTFVWRCVLYERRPA